MPLALPMVRGRRLARVALVASLLLSCPRPVFAAKTDLIVMKNGDRITGEVKGIERARLELSTDSMGTIYIEIEDISEVTSNGYFEVEDTNGARFYGQLRPAGPGRLGVMLGDKTEVVDLQSIARLQPIGRTFFRRFDGSIDLGASYTQSSGIAQGSLSAGITFRRPSFETSLMLDSTVTVQKTEPTTSRYSLQFGYLKYLRGRWLLPGIAQFESNRDLGLKLRSLLGVGIGRMLVVTTHQGLTVSGGIDVNREIPVEGDTTSNVEAFFNLSHSYFTYNSPKTNLSTRVFLYPSLSDPGRWRLTLDSSIKRELVKDFNVGFSIYDTYDSRPPDATAAKNDIGLSLTLGWSF